MTPTPPWKLVYADGSANVYRFDAQDDGVDFAYDPVTPERSSTGFYSGGDPRAARFALDDPRIAELWRSVRALEADTSSHADARCKGDGAVTLVTPEGSHDFLVVRAATRELEALLERL